MVPFWSKQRQLPFFHTKKKSNRNSVFPNIFLPFYTWSQKIDFNFQNWISFKYCFEEQIAEHQEKSVSYNIYNDYGYALVPQGISEYLQIQTND